MDIATVLSFFRDFQTLLVLFLIFALPTVAGVALIAQQTEADKDKAKAGEVADDELPF